jgi:hypothetical protein
MNASRSKSEDSRLKENVTECFNESRKHNENASFLAVKFEKLVVSKNTSNHTSGINSSMVLKSEQQVMKAKRSNKKKPLISKSKLANSFSLLRENITDQCSVDDKTQQPEVFGRKFSFSLENFNSLSLQDKTEETVGQSSKVYDTESFKHINGSVGKRKRERCRSCDQRLPVAGAGVSCGQEARMYSDVTVEDLAGYLDDTTFFPKRMSHMAEMMYT